jgi:hypothetical protein
MSQGTPQQFWRHFLYFSNTSTLVVVSMEVISDFVATEQRADSMPEADQYQNEVDFNGFSDPFASAGF